MPLQRLRLVSADAVDDLRYDLVVTEAGQALAIQWMEDAAKIIAINDDPEAPIFSVATYGIVGDLKTIIPLMIKALRERR